MFQDVVSTCPCQSLGAPPAPPLCSPAPRPHTSFIGKGWFCTGAPRPPAGAPEGEGGGAVVEDLSLLQVPGQGGAGRQLLQLPGRDRHVGHTRPLAGLGPRDGGIHLCHSPVSVCASKMAKIDFSEASLDTVGSHFLENRLFKFFNM